MPQPQQSVRRRVVVTGMGIVTCLGTGLDAFWRGLVEARSGIGRLTKFDPTGLRNEKAGQVWDWRFDPADFGLASAPDETTQFLLASTREALNHAGLSDGAFDPARAGVVLATNFGGGMSWEEHVARRLAEQPSNHTFPEAAFHTPLVHLARVFDLRGPGMLLSIACASGTAAVGCALEMIRRARADVVVAGGHDSLTPSCLAGLSILATMTREEIRPFSANRSGTLFGEGAAALVLESLDHARDRGAEPLAEVLGSWQTNNAYHLAAPDKGARGMTRVLAEAIADAGVEPSEIDYVNAHGTGTQAHDPEETHAIKAVLGDHAYRIPVSSIKAAIAHTMGAAGACEAVATVQTLRTGLVPPTLNYAEPDLECDLDYVPNHAREADVKCAASMSAGVGGSNACLVLSAVLPSPEGRGAGGEGRSRSPLLKEGGQGGRKPSPSPTGSGAGGECPSRSPLLKEGGQGGRKPSSSPAGSGAGGECPSRSPLLKEGGQGGRKPSSSPTGSGAGGECPSRSPLLKEGGQGGRKPSPSPPGRGAGGEGT